MRATLSTAACMLSALPSAADSMAGAADAHPDDRTAFISIDDYAGPWPFKADQGFFFCYRTGPLHHLTFHEYPDGPNAIDPPGLGFSLEKEAVGLMLETVAQGKYLRPWQEPEQLMGAISQLRQEARTRCGAPYDLNRHRQESD